MVSLEAGGCPKGSNSIPQGAGERHQYTLLIDRKPFHFLGPARRCSCTISPLYRHVATSMIRRTSDPFSSLYVHETILTLSEALLTFVVYTEYATNLRITNDMQIETFFDLCIVPVVRGFNIYMYPVRR